MITEDNTLGSKFVDRPFLKHVLRKFDLYLSMGNTSYISVFSSIPISIEDIKTEFKNVFSFSSGISLEYLTIYTSANRDQSITCINTGGIHFCKQFKVTECLWTKRDMSRSISGHRKGNIGRKHQQDAAIIIWRRISRDVLEVEGIELENTAFLKVLVITFCF